MNQVSETKTDLIFDNKGKFSVVIDGKPYEAIFYSDYRRLFNLTRYEVDKREKAGEITRLKIKGRKRLDSVILIDSNIKGDCLSDEFGKFYIEHSGNVYPVMFVSQYAEKYGFDSKQVVHHHLNYKGDNEYCCNLQHYVRKVVIKRGGSDQDIILVAFFENQNKKDNDNREGSTTLE